MTATVTIPLPPAERERLAERWSALPAMRALGARADFSGEDAVRIVLDRVQPFHRGGLGTEAVNGAVIAGLCDAAVGMVGHFQAPTSQIGTVQLSIQFQRPVTGERVTAVGRLVKGGRQLIFARCEIEDERGQVCAVCDGIVAVLGPGTGGLQAENVAL
jgi:uncharacterized protein (TIGR00369 family)